LIIGASGNYNIQVANKNGCKVAVGINIILGMGQLNAYGLQFTVSPNPVDRELIIMSDGVSIEKIEIYNMLGEKIYSLQSEIVNHKSEIEVDVSAMPQGIYFVQLSGSNSRWTGRFVKE
jgi:hypothetical protein